MLTDKTYPNHYPRFDIKRALSYKVKYAEGDVVESKLQSIPSELIDASSVMSYEILAAADWLIDEIDERMNEFKHCIKGKSFGGLTVDDYDNALANNDYETITEFEEFNTCEISGSTAAEIYCLLSQIKDKVKWLRDFVNDNIVPVKAKSGKRLAEAEEELYSQLAYMEYKNPGSVDRLALAYEAQLKYQIMKRIEDLTTIVNSCIDVAKSTLNDSCNGDASFVAGEMAAAGRNVIEHLTTILGLAFAELAGDALAYKDQDRQIGLEEIRRNMHCTAISLKELRLDASRSIVNWLMSAGADNDESPLYTLANFALDGLTVVDSGLDTTIVNIYKSHKLEKQNLDQQVGNILYRKQIRQFMNLAKALLSTVDFNKPEEERRKQGRIVGEVLARKSEGMCS